LLLHSQLFLPIDFHFIKLLLDIEILFFPDLVDIRDTTFRGHVFAISTSLFSSQVQGFFFIFTKNRIVAVTALSFLSFISAMMAFD
jgi:hypothetical protein